MHKHAIASARKDIFARLNADKDHGSASSEAFSSPVHLSPPSTRHNSRASSPFSLIQSAGPRNVAGHGADGGLEAQSGHQHGLPDPGAFEDHDKELLEEWDNEWDADEDEMPSDLRPSMDGHGKGRPKSLQPLLSSKDHAGYDSHPRPTRSASRHSRLHERDPDLDARNATKRRYFLASIFLALSLITFAVQTETAVYITKHLGWKKSYCML